jgi:hypothetical protein
VLLVMPDALAVRLVVAAPAAGSHQPPAHHPAEPITMFNSVTWLYMPHYVGDVKSVSN